MPTWGDMAKAPEVDSKGFGLELVDVLWMVQKTALALDLDPFNTTSEDRARLSNISTKVLSYLRDSNLSMEGTDE